MKIFIPLKFYEENINKSKRNSKKMWSAIKNLISQKKNDAINKKNGIDC